MSELGHLIMLRTKGGATIFKVGVQVRERSERKNFFKPPLLAYLGDIKQDITVFITAIMTYYKRLYLPAPNDFLPRDAL